MTIILTIVRRRERLQSEVMRKGERPSIMRYTYKDAESALGRHDKLITKPKKKKQTNTHLNHTLSYYINLTYKHRSFE